MADRLCCSQHRNLDLTLLYCVVVGIKIDEETVKRLLKVDVEPQIEQLQDK